MIKKTITFENFLGETETEDFYFNMSKGELVKMQMAAVDQKTESLQDKLDKIGKTLNGQALIDLVDEIVLGGYGVKSTDGKKFEKNERLSEDFKSTGAYSELIVELCTNSEKMAEFVNGLMPANLRDAVNKEVSEKTARQRSEEKLQGFKQKEVPSVQTVPELPTEIKETADPVLSPSDVEAEEFRKWQEAKAAQQ